MLVAVALLAGAQASPAHAAESCRTYTQGWVAGDLPALASLKMCTVTTGFYFQSKMSLDTGMWYQFQGATNVTIQGESVATVGSTTTRTPFSRNYYSNNPTVTMWSPTVKAAGNGHVRIKVTRMIFHTVAGPVSVPDSTFGPFYSPTVAVP